MKTEDVILCSRNAVERYAQVQKQLDERAHDLDAGGSPAEAAVLVKFCQTMNDLGIAISSQSTERPSRSAWDAMPTRQAELRAAEHPVAGDRWEEMMSYWMHVDEVTDEHVLVRCYVGPCQMRPEECKSEHTIPRAQFRDWILARGVSFDGNARYVARAGGRYDEGIALGFTTKITHWTTTDWRAAQRIEKEK